MNASELMKKIIEYGADENGINDRFMGNVELYESCLLEFLEEPNFGLLKHAIQTKEYEQAFAAAHALKGLSGNLGITAFYEAVYRLVESLRVGSYEAVDAEYQEVERQLTYLKDFILDKPGLYEAEAEVHDAFVPELDLKKADGAEMPEEEADGFSTSGPESAESGDFSSNLREAAIKADFLPEDVKIARMKSKKDLLTMISVIVLLIIITGVCLLFFNINVKYKDNISQESARHLEEINYQLKLYIEERIESDWKVAYTMADSIQHSNFNDDNVSVAAFLQRKREIWNITDITIYTENGNNICADGDIKANDIASDIIDKARENGEYMRILDSQITYTVPVETEQQYKGSKIVAISVIQDMGSFLDEMGFSSFDGKAYMYLTEENGIVISKLTNEAAATVFNFGAVAAGHKITALTDEGLSAADLLTTSTPMTFLMSGLPENEYVVSTPIYTRRASLRLFYLAPESVVNETMNLFSMQLVISSLCVIFIFAVFAILIFLFIYRVRKREFNEEIIARDHMFDLLIRKSRASFGFFSVNEKKPVYVSDNAISIVGARYYALDKSESGFSMRNSEDTQTAAIRQINERMREWDGKSEFKSGYILNDCTTPNNYFELQIYPVDDEGKDFVGIAQDVTQAYERENTTRTALEMAEHANKSKSDFLSNMSHDIRTPMNAIVNMTAFAMDSLGSPDMLKRYLKTISESSHHLLRLINDILDMSRIESGHTVIGSEPFDIIREINRQAEIIRPLCMVKNLTFITDFDGIQTNAVLGDPLKFSQIITNLLSNAVKFTPANGAVRFVATEIASLREDIADMRFVVEDNGMGIAKDYLKRIFDPFSRADNRQVNHIEGTGLGLSICRSYVNAMGGTIQCQSEEGEGTVFTVDLFFRKADYAPEENTNYGIPDNMPFLGKCCLVAEDNGTNQEIAKIMLERLGFIVEIAYDGRECVQRFEKSRAGHYDVIYMDIQMPVMDGYEAAVAVRKSEHADAKVIPIIAMSANYFAEDIEKARIAGMDGYLGKPIISLKLVEETFRIFNNGEEKSK